MLSLPHLKAQGFHAASEGILGRLQINSLSALILMKIGSRNPDGSMFGRLNNYQSSTEGGVHRIASPSAPLVGQFSLGKSTGPIAVDMAVLKAHLTQQSKSSCLLSTGTSLHGRAPSCGRAGWLSG